MTEFCLPNALFTAVEAGDDAAAIRALEAGNDVNARDTDYFWRDGRTALHMAAMHDNAVMIRLLVERGADVNSQTTWGETPLWYASIGGNYQAVQTLIDLGADRTIPCRTGETPQSRIAQVIGKYLVVLDVLNDRRPLHGRRA